MDACASEETILELCAGRLSEGEAAEVVRHADGCAACRELIAAVAASMSLGGGEGDGDGDRDGDGEREKGSEDGERGDQGGSGADAVTSVLRAGTKVGRYVVVRPLGSGAMGVVYEAEDPELGRKVALKLVRAEALAGPLAGEAAARLGREARALAKLSHPNVIAVHDVGAFGRGVFVAMELVDGGTLSQWLSERARSIDEVLGALLQAAEGLAAAHAAGIVHRDVKPENVLVGKDGRVRVTDFGLARGEASHAAKGAASAPGGTQTGILAGAPAQPAGAERGAEVASARKQTGTLADASAPLDGAEKASGASPSMLERSPPFAGGASELGGAGARSATGGGHELHVSRDSWRRSKGAPGGTRTGMLVGTPAYMAPEQLRGGAADVRSDQFAFCLLAYEALYGERPFAGGSLEALLRAMEAGEPRPLPRDRSVAPWLYRALLRGLRAAPEQRYPDMRALVEALRAGPRRRRATVAVAVVMGVAAIGALGLVWKRSPPCCADPAASWAEAWSPSRAAAIHATFARSGRPSAAFAEGAVTRSLDAYGAAWIGARAAACGAADKDPSSEPSNRRLACLEERRLEVAALARALAEADGDAVEAAPAALSTLPRVEECTGGAALRMAVLPSGDAAHRAAMERLRERLAEARALEAAGRAPAGLAVVVPAVTEAKALGETALTGRLLYVQGALEYDAGQSEPAASTLHAAAETALGAGDDATAADAWILLTRVAGHRLGRAAEGRQWTSYAEAAIRRLGGDDAREAARLYATGLVAWSAERRLDEARAAFEKARALAEKSLGPSHPLVAAADTGLGNVLLAEAKPDQALIAHQRAAHLQEQILGPDAPATRFARVDVAVDLVALDRPDEAIALLARTLDDLARGCPGCDDAFARHRLAAALRAKGDPERALAEDRRAQQTMTRLSAPDRERAWAIAGEGMDLLALGKPGEAVSLLESALALREKSGAPAEIAEVELALAQALWQSGGDRARARSLAEAARDGYRDDASRHGGYYQRALESAEAWLTDHPDSPTALQPSSGGAAARGGAPISMGIPVTASHGGPGFPAGIPAAAASGGVPGYARVPAAGPPPAATASKGHD